MKKVSHKNRMYRKLMNVSPTPSSILQKCGERIRGTRAMLRMSKHNYLQVRSTLQCKHYLGFELEIAFSCISATRTSSEEKWCVFAIRRLFSQRSEYLWQYRTRSLPLALYAWYYIAEIRVVQRSRTVFPLHEFLWVHASAEVRHYACKV